MKSSVRVLCARWLVEMPKNPGFVDSAVGAGFDRLLNFIVRHADRILVLHNMACNATIFGC